MINKKLIKEIFSTSNEITTNKLYNGKPVYRRCYELTATSATQDFDTGITNFNKVITFSALPVYLGGTYAGMQYSSTSDKANIYINSNGTKFCSRLFISNNSYPTWRIVLEYTKTTD